MILVMKIENRRAYYDYSLGERIEAGMVLTGAEMKSVRLGRINLNQSFIRIINSEVYLVNANIPPARGADPRTYEPTRSRKLLLHKKEVERIEGILTSKGTKGVPGNLTIVSVLCYIKHGLAKLEIAIAQGKKEYEKREAIKQRDMERDLQREFRGKDVDIS